MFARRAYLDTDFVALDVCCGRQGRSALRNWLLDRVCALTGHLLWRTGARRVNPEGSLDLHAVYCRRCFRGGYVRGDYAS